MPAEIEKLKNLILEFTQYNDGRDDIGHYELVTTVNDNGKELLLWKLIQGGGWINKYQVIESAHFRMDSARLFPKKIKVVLTVHRQDSGCAEVVVDRKAGTATLTASSRSSDTVVEELVKLVAEYVNRSALNHFVNYSFVVTWKTDHYHIDLTESEDWAQR